MPRRVTKRLGVLLAAAVVASLVWWGRSGPSESASVLGAEQVQAAAGAPFIVGFDEDAVKFDPRVGRLLRELGARAVRITLQWEPGERSIAADDVRAIEQALRAVGDARVVLTVYAHSGANAPVTEGARDDYCEYLRSTLDRFRAIRDVVIWNEPNKSHFWRPQFDADGASTAPAAYMQLLARCWDVLHAARPDINVVAPATSPRGNDNPRAASNVSHSPGAFIRAVGRAYRDSGRSRPLFDTVGHHVYGEHSAERPWRHHRFSSTIALGDWRELMQALWDGFAETGQPIPGRCIGDRCARIWYLETGYQTVPDADKAGLYAGAENSPYSLPDFGGGDPPGVEVRETSPAPDQATQIRDAIRLAYCQPHVEAVFNFLVVDERNLAGWQSGAFWPDHTPKGSHEAFRSAIEAAQTGAVECARLKGAAPPRAFRATTTVELLRLAWPPARTFSRANALWRFRVMTGEDARYDAQLLRIDRGRAVVARRSGLVREGRFGFIRFPQGRLPPGRYQIEVMLSAAGNPARTAKRTSPVFLVRGKGRQQATRRPAPRQRTFAVSPQSVVLSPIPVRPPDALNEEAPQIAVPDLGATPPVSSLAVRLTDPEAIEGELVAEMNRVRRARNLRPLRAVAALARAGDRHARSLALAGQFSHDWPDGRPFSRWIASFYPSDAYRTWSAGENLLWTAGALSPREAVRLWLQSPPHRRILLSPRWREIGVGVVRAERAGGVFGGLSVAVAAAEFGVRVR